MTNDAIWIVNDDKDDHELIKEIIQGLDVKNKVVFFDNGPALISELANVKVAPFIIMCDVNLPRMDGFAIREKLLETPDQRFHSVPFIFWSTYASEEQIEKAYKLRAHGFFIKDGEFKKWKSAFETIIKYWATSKMPSKKAAYDEPLTQD